MKTLQSLPVTAAPGVTLPRINRLITAYNLAERREARHLARTPALNTPAVAKLQTLSCETDEAYRELRKAAGL